TRKMILDEKQIQAIFLFEFKMGHKAVETIHNINNAFGPETANECTVQWWFKTFCKGYESLEHEEIIEADQLTTTQVAEELNFDHSMIVQHLKQIGKVKKLDKWVPHRLTANQKYHHFEVSSSLVVQKQQGTISRSDSDNDQLIGWTEKKLQSTSQTQQIDEIMGPILLHDNILLHVAQAVLQKLNDLGYEVLPHLPYSPDLSPTDYHFFKHLNNFLQGKHFHNQQDAENAFQEFVKSQSMGF
ncbi:hypothetical protein FD754_004107, partial [Muntiacus muntjak]